MFVDHAGTLWVAPERHSVVRLNFPPPLSRFEIKVGLSGTVSDVVRHKGVLYTSTPAVGVVVPRCRDVHVQTGHRVHTPLFAGDGAGVPRRGLDGGIRIEGLHQMTGPSRTSSSPTSGHRSPVAPSGSLARIPKRLWIALEDGLATMQLNNRGHWVDDESIPELVRA